VFLKIGLLWQQCYDTFSSRLHLYPSIYCRVFHCLIGFCQTLEKGQIIEGGSNDSFFDEATEKEENDGLNVSEPRDDEREEKKTRALANDGSRDVETGSMEESSSKGGNAASSNSINYLPKTCGEIACAYGKVLLPYPGIPKETLFVNEEKTLIESNDLVPRELQNETANAGGVEVAVVGMGKCREVKHGCAVCLELFTEGERVCWSSNNQCPHVFHELCIVDWLVALGKRKRNRGWSDDEEDNGGTANFPMLCPCCRQDFMIRRAP